MGTPTPEEFLTIEQVCDLLKLSQRNVYEMCRTRQLPGVAKVGSRWRVNKKELLDWMAAGGDAADGNHARQDG